jgi:hypothetical protein
MVLDFVSTSLDGEIGMEYMLNAMLFNIASTVLFSKGTIFFSHKKSASAAASTKFQ